MSTQLLTIDQEAQSFELVQRQAKLLASSTLVPKEFQGNMGNCAIALNIAKRMDADPFMVVQNVDVIHGRPSFRATFLIAMVNASGRFTPLQFRMTGEGQSRACVAHAKDKDSGESVEGPEVSMAMAKAEGWATKNGSKWQTMPELMLRYRAAAFFARLYAPDITLGMQTSEEVHESEPPRNVTPIKRDAKDAKDPFAAALEVKAEPEPIDPSDDSVADTTGQMIPDIRETCRELEMTEASFEGRARKNGWMPRTAMLSTLAAEELHDIWNNRMAIARGEVKL